MELDNQYMKIAMDLARKGEGYTSPNPLVGAVIVKDGRIIAEGCHEYYGGPHAEINAMSNTIEDMRNSTIYVTLEPCSHYGKTPPCAEAIVRSGIARVVIACRDPNPLVSGRGIMILEKAGIQVEVGVLEEEGKRLNEIFFNYISTKLPFVIMKTAMTLDGKIATKTNASKWITGKMSREYVHELRHRVSGVMVGIGTILADDPSLTTRLSTRKGKDAVRIIVDSKARIPLTSKVLNLKSEARTIIAVTEEANKDKIQMILEQGADVIIVPSVNGRVDMKELMKELGKRKIDSILLEGGSDLNYSALEAGIVHKVISFISPKIIGGNTAKTPVGGEGKALMEGAYKLEYMKTHLIGEDIMIEGYIKEGSHCLPD